MGDLVTVVAYLTAAFLSARAAAKAGSDREPRGKTFWLIITALLFILGVNKVLDLQTLFTTAGRAHAKANGWFEKRREVQFYFVLSLGGVTALAGIAMVWFTRRSGTAVKLALVGLFFIGLFVFLRAASFHHFSEILSDNWTTLDRWLLHELVGILTVSSAAMLYIQYPQSRT